MHKVLRDINAILSANFYNTDKKMAEPAVAMNVPINSGTLSFLSYSFDKRLSTKEYPKGLFPFFNKNKGVHSMCDYMLFSYFNNKLYILLIELKHGKEGVMPQLNAGKCLAKFIVDTYNRIEGKTLRVEYRMISIRNNHIIKKRPTKIRSVDYDENNFCTFEGCNFYLREFLK